jgi:PAS domain S-box-containing protein
LAVQGYGIDGVTNYWNKASERIYGYTEQEAIGRNLLDLIIPEEMRIEVSHAIKKMMKTGVTIPESELSLMRKDGSRVDVFSSHAIIQSSAHPPEFFCLDIDISDRKKSEDALRASKETAETLLNVAAEIILSMDFDGNIKLLNPAGHALLGYESPELIGKNWFDTCLSEGAKVAVKDFSRSLEMNGIESIVTHENEVITRTGEPRTIYWRNTLIRDRGGRVTGWFCSGEDITERKKTGDALKESQERLRFALEVSGLGEWSMTLGATGCTEVRGGPECWGMMLRKSGMTCSKASTFSIPTIARRSVKQSWTTSKGVPNHSRQATGCGPKMAGINGFRTTARSWSAMEKAIRSVSAERILTSMSRSDRKNLSSGNRKDCGMSSME